MTTAGPDDDEQWLLLVYRIPAEPTRLRAMVWRRLKALGAVYLQNSAAALPARDGAERALRKLRREILDKCVDFHAGLEKEYATTHFTYGELEENEVELAKLRSWYEKVEACDAYGAPKRAEAARALDECGEVLELYAARVYEEEDEGR
jgi:DNA-binding transcriptional regulator PaaX